MPAHILLKCLTVDVCANHKLVILTFFTLVMMGLFCTFETNVRFFRLEILTTAF